MLEVWKTIPGSDCRYDASILGKIRRALSAGGQGAQAGKVLKTCLNNRGYLQVDLYLSGGKKKFLVHRLVALTFIGPCPPGKGVNHKDTIKTNCALSNLEYTTPIENMYHAGVMGLMTKRKLSKRDVSNIRRSCLSLRVLANKYDVATATIWYVLKKKTYKNVS